MIGVIGSGLACIWVHQGHPAHTRDTRQTTDIHTYRHPQGQTTDDRHTDRHADKPKPALSQRGAPCKGIYRWDLPLGHTAGTYRWDLPLGHTAGTYLWDLPLGPTVGTYRWDLPLEPNVGTHRRDLPLGPTSALGYL